VFHVQHCADGMDDGGDANRGNHGFFRDSLLPQHLVMSVDTLTATLTADAGQAPHFKVHRVGLMRANCVHSQPVQASWRTFYSWLDDGNDRKCCSFPKRRPRAGVDQRPS
jgi:hypothetical protein